MALVIQDLNKLRKMGYLHRHYNCQPGCRVYTAYIRIKNKWRRIGQYYTKCEQFKPDTKLNETIKPATEKIVIDTRTYNIIPKRVENYHPYQVSDKELLELCNSLGNA